MDSKQMVDALLEVDPGFEQLCKTLFGDLVEPADVWDFMYSQDGLAKIAPVAKAMPDASAVRSGGGRLMRVIRRNRGKAAAGTAATAGAVVLAKPDKPAQLRRYDSDGMHVLKSDEMDVVWEGTFSKTDDDKHQAFGWASVVEINGKPIVDRQGDWITPDEIEKAAYKYVLENRRGGNQHKRDDQDQPLHASSLIESFVVTPEKIEKMGLPADTPIGWWVGYKVHDEDAWQDIKKGVRTGFSIHGRGKRHDVEDVEKRLVSSLRALEATGVHPAAIPGISSGARARIAANRSGQLYATQKSKGALGGKNLGTGRRAREVSRREGF